MNFVTRLIKKFSSKKGMDVADYIKILDRNPEINFQIDFFREGIFMDLQIFRQKVLKNDKKFNLEIIRPDDYVLELAFFLDEAKSKEAFKKFKNTDLFKKSRLTHASKNEEYFRYLLYITEDNLKLLNNIKYIIEEIYVYDKNTDYTICFHDFDKYVSS